MKPRAEEAVAVIGMACRFPGGVNGPEDLWNMLEAGRDGTGPIPPSRFDIDAWFDPDVETPGRIATRRGGFLDGDVSAFDAGFFDVPPSEAEAMDPQIRILLELGYEALEDAGQDLNRLSGGPHGIYAGVCFSEYQEQLKASAASRPLDSFFICGTNSCSASGRLSYHFGFEGPSLTLNAACSSSLLAVHLACRDLASGETDLALAGGVNLMLSPETFVGFSRLRVLAPDGRCKAFDVSADGYARAEGAGLVCLKRLHDARRDGDRILAVVEASALTNDGAARGYTAPRPEAQEKAIRMALARAGLSIDDIDVIEAHGTGTRLGDRMEMKALAQVMAGRDPSLPPVRLGAIKSNIGHCEAAAGVASLIKMVLALRAGRVPAHLNYQSANPAIDWPHNLQVETKTSDWPRTRRRRCGINSFGMSGVNVHVVLAEAEPGDATPAVAREAPATPAGLPMLLPLSARSPEALRALGQSWLSILDIAPGEQIQRLAASQLWRRTPFRNRLTAVGTSAASLRADLRRKLALAPPDVRKPAVVGLLFAGEESAPGPIQLEAYRNAHERAIARLESATSDQAGLYAFHHGMAAQLASFGVMPVHFEGVGAGQIVARELAGQLAPQDAARAVASGVRPVSGDLMAAAQRLVEAGCDVVMQVGGMPHQASLHVVIAGRNGEEEQRHAVWLPALADGDDPVLAMVEARALLHDHGVDLPRDLFHSDPRQHWCDTPRYPWQRQTYWIAPGRAGHPPASAGLPAATLSGSPLERVCMALSELLGLPPSRIDPDLAMSQLGLDSLMAISLVARIGHGLSPTVIWSHPTARKLARHLAERQEPQVQSGADVPLSPSPSIFALESELDALLEKFG